MLWIAAGVVGVVVLAIVLAVVFTRGGSSTSASDLPVVGSLQDSLPGSADINTELKGVPQHGLTLGSPKAPVTSTASVIDPLFGLERVTGIIAQPPSLHQRCRVAYPGLVQRNPMWLIPVSIIWGRRAAGR